MCNETPFVEKGWQCPVCGAVMAPHESHCSNCTGKHFSTYGSGGTDIPIIPPPTIIC